MRPDVAERDAGTVDSTSQEQSLANLLEQVTRQLDDGEAVDVEELAREYPQHADRLRELMPTMLAMASWGRAPALGEDGEASTRASPHVAGVLGDFRIIRELGRGGMGTVFEAEQISMGRRVALKILPFAALANERALQRFRNEVRAAAALDHPHIVSVYSVGEERGIHYYSMQLIRGRTLAEVIAEERRVRRRTSDDAESGQTGYERPNGDTLTIESAVSPQSSTRRDEQAHMCTAVDSQHNAKRYRTTARLGIEAAEALQHAHDQGVLHRDIKPSNLLLDGEGKLYVVDFGLARIESDAEMTMTGDLVGTLRYMAPEQALAKRVVIDQRADVYSLGATLYELLTLQPAFGETDRAELLTRIAFEEPIPPRKLVPSIPVELETIVLKTMAKSPDERYQTAQQLAEDLTAYLENRPIRARAPSTLDRLAKWSRRHVAIVWSASVVLFTCTVVLIIASLQIAKWYREAEQQRDIARGQVAEAEKQKKNAQAVSNLLQEMLASADPDQTKGANYTVRQLLDDFSVKLDSQLADQPEIEATVHATFGNAYQRLEIAGPAKQHLEAALQIRRKAFGPEDLSVADSLVDYSFFLLAAPRPRPPIEEIIANVKQALSIYRKSGKITEQMLNAYAVLEQALSVQADMTGNYEEAEATAHEALRLVGDIDSASFPAVAILLHNLSRVERSQGKLAEAETTARRSVVLHRKLHGNQHPETAWGLMNLGFAQQAQRKLLDAESAYRESLLIFRQEFNPAHKYVNVALSALLDVLEAKGDSTEVDLCLQQALAELDRHLEADPGFIQGWRMRADLNLRLGQCREALDDCNEAIRVSSENVNCVLYRAQVYLRLGRSKEARADFNAVLAKSPDNPTHLNATAWALSTSPLSSFRDGAKAVQFARQACELVEYTRPGFIDTLAAAYAEAGDFKSAVEWSEIAIDLCDKNQHDEYSRHLDSFRQGNPWREE